MGWSMAEVKTEQTGLIGAAQLAKACNVSKQVIQYYLMLGLLKEIQRTAGGHRRFKPDVVTRVKLIRRLNKSGYTLRDIREMFLKDR